MTQRIVLDVASYQGPTPDLTGVDGLMIKAVEGEWPNTNPYMDAQVQWAVQHGKPYGFYDFWHPMFAGTADMQMFISKISGYKPALGAVVDAEVNDGIDPVTVLDRLLEDLKFVNLYFPMRTWLYSAAWWMDPNLYGPQKYEIAQLSALWVAGYTQSLPRIPDPFKSAIMWQFTDHWRGGNQDASYFLGSDEQWNWLIGNVTPGPIPLSEKIKRLQAAVHGKQDGIFGPDTYQRVMGIRAMKDVPNRSDPAKVKYAQQVMAFPAFQTNGVYNKITHDQIGSTIKKMQLAMGVTPVDGTWSANTEFAEIVLDPFR